MSVKCDCSRTVGSMAQFLHFATNFLELFQKQEFVSWFVDHPRVEPLYHRAGCEMEWLLTTESYPEPESTIKRAQRQVPTTDNVAKRTWSDAESILHISYF